MRSKTLTVTSTNMAASAYCQRLFYINKTMSQKGFISSLPIVQGNIEHEAWGILSEALDVSWRKWILGKTSLAKVAETAVAKTLSHVFSLTLENYLSYALDIKKYMEDLTFRTSLWLATQETKILQMVRNGFHLDYIVSSTLPWKIEEKIFRDEFELYGRVNVIYNDGRYLIHEDIKTRQSRFKALLQKYLHKTQFLCYCIMIEARFDMPSPKTKFFYAQDLSYETFKITIQEKEQPIGKITTARDLIKNSEIPSMLSKEEAVKCKHYYARDQCYKLACQEGKEAWVDKLVNNSEGNFNLFGGRNYGN